MTVLKYDVRSNNFEHVDEVIDANGEITYVPHRFGHRAGEKIRPVFKRNKTTRRLEKVDEYDIDKYINSFKEETNVKDLVEKLRAKGVTPEEYMKRRGGFYGDIAEAPQSVLEAVEMANDFEDKVDAYERMKDSQNAKNEPSKEKEPKKDEPKKEEEKK